jgi:hypothetical protein
MPACRAEGEYNSLSFKFPPPGLSLLIKQHGNYNYGFIKKEELLNKIQI